MTHSQPIWHSRFLAAGGSVALTCFAFSQGPLTPPSAPAPAMKTLEQIEPRTPMNDTAVPGDADYHHIISTPGSYYLTGNLVVTKANGIDVRAEGVTLDLNGFEISRSVGARGNGIEVDATSHRCTIKNGSLKSFGHGLRCVVTTNFARGGRCLHLSVSGCSEAGLVAGERWQLDGCTAHDNTATGIFAASGSSLSNCTASANSAGIDASRSCTLTNCTAANNTTGAGISASTGSTLTNCTAADNTGTYGIFADDGSTFTNCSAVGNIADAGFSAGIFAGDGCTLTNCSATSNTIEYGIYTQHGCTLKNCAARSNTGASTFTGGIRAEGGCTLVGCAATGNTNTNATASPSTGYGIRTFFSSTVQDCSVSGNDGDGIQIDGGRCHVSGNTCTGNTGGGQGAGIHLLGEATACRIDGNHCSGGTRGIWVEGTDNLIIRNSAQGASVLAYEITVGNHSGAIVGDPGLSFASTSPWANFRF
jgi:parallel beta-helix repeat protein